jgi:hypothetical protein
MLQILPWSACSICWSLVSTQPREIPDQETDMLTEYRGWTIDATPDSFFGKYFARARIVQAFSDDLEEPEMHIERDIEWFDRKDDAIERAVDWAIAWIDARPETTETFRLKIDEEQRRQRGVLVDG